MTIENGLHSHLTGDSAIAALVALRIFPVIAPQGTLRPYMTYQRITAKRVRSLGGPSGLANPRFQIDCWAEDYDGALDLGEKVRAAMDGFTGVMGTVTVGAVLLDSDRDDHEIETELFRRSMDFFLWHDEV